MDYSSKRTGCGIMLLLFCFIMICMTGCGKREREEFSVYTANDGMLTVSGPEVDVDVWMELLRQTENVYVSRMRAVLCIRRQYAKGWRNVPMRSCAPR